MPSTGCQTKNSQTHTEEKNHSGVLQNFTAALHTSQDRHRCWGGACDTAY